MTYVLSDIHGNLQRFENMLKKIDLKSEDKLYILGDVIDRYPYGIDILLKIMDMPNAKMLLGNHEYMMLRALERPYDGIEDIKGKEVSDLFKLWNQNKGGETYMQWLITPEDVQEKIIDYIHSLPLNIDIEVNGIKYKLVHAAPVDWYDLAVLIGKAKNITKTSFAVWERDMVMCYPPKTDYTVIFGHTHTYAFCVDKNPMEIWKDKNLIGIDCGSGDIYPPDYPEEMIVKGRLACLRLDDMKEFYSE